ncbi:MAG: hypothetical protein HC802_17120 [Caldilineaceae bacterium]|nr:hypothetical protein [Caldilineaceae bacterium]
MFSQESTNRQYPRSDRRIRSGTDRFTRGIRYHVALALIAALMLMGGALLAERVSAQAAPNAASGLVSVVRSGGADLLDSPDGAAVASYVVGDSLTARGRVRRRKLDFRRGCRWRRGVGRQRADIALQRRHTAGG